ncbi:hypothetical protein DLAC_05373 [Tieghemostelium lacteum]|uniref:EGF-like domain-containing protein n=1 Tax=Tieghemostelium lacteum TaxID=361077 RepID=A0A151ZFN9_TIELA|nr:hypothetical protein DLAC_05373 [Tieghemostelium lacteum]|eukprot:KYQ92791.1 hypothetical protein DLAC_05373 [Tieghemostelium lacteum]
MRNIIIFISLFLYTVVYSQYKLLSIEGDDNQNNAYASTNSYCELIYRVTIVNEQSGLFSVDSFGLANESIAMIVTPTLVYQQVGYWVGLLTFQAPIGNNSLSVNLKNNLNITDGTLKIVNGNECLLPPNPIPIQSVDSLYCQEDWCTMKLILNINRFLDFTIVTKNSNDIICSRQTITMQIHVLKCSINNALSTFPSPLLIELIDKLFRTTQRYISLDPLIPPVGATPIMSYQEYYVGDNITSGIPFYHFFTISNFPYFITTQKGIFYTTSQVINGNPQNRTKYSIILPSIPSFSTSTIYFKSTTPILQDSFTFSVMSDTDPEPTPTMGYPSFSNIANQILFTSNFINVPNGQRVYRGIGSMIDGSYNYRFPIGVINGNFNNCSIVSLVVLSNFNCTLALNSFHYTFTATYSDNIPPVLTSIEYIRISNFKYVVRVSAYDLDSGIYSIELVSSSAEFPILFTLDSSKLVGGTLFNGTFETVFEFDTKYPYSSPYSYQITDLVSNQNIYTTNIGLTPIPKFPFYNSGSELDLYRFTISKLYFKLNDIDLTDIGCQNTLYLNYSSIGVTSIAQLTIYINRQTTIIAKGEWNSVEKMITIDFNLPARLYTSDLQYLISTNEFIYTSQTIVTILGHESRLRVKSDWADMEPPFVIELYTLNTVTEFGWRLTIEDSYNGLLGGIVSVVSDLDGLEYNFTITPRITNSIYLSTYPITILKSVTSVTQTYRISYLQLTDRQGYISDSLNTLYMNPFIKLHQDIPTITVVGVNTLDSDPPFIQNISYINNVINVAGPSRKFFIIFTITDILSPISQRHTPFCVLNGRIFETYSVPAVYTSIDDSKTLNAICSVTLPYAFGYGSGSIYLSIYGYSDIFMNFGGYTSGDTNESLPIPIIFDPSIVPPEITGTSDITSQGGDIEIYGYGFNSITQLSISYDNNPTSYNLTLTTITNFVVTASGVLSGYSKAYIIATVGTRSSEQYLITFIPFNPTTPPVIKCSGVPECGGTTNGVCTTNGCKCIGPWVGQDCLSQVLNNNVTINPSNPNSGSNYNTTIEDKPVSLHSLITLVSLDELNFNATVIKSHEFKEWLYTNTTKVNSTIQEYQYETSINYRNTVTKVKVLVQYFTNRDSVFFAGEYLEMLPSTLKYKISFSPYAFESDLNSLRLVMSASLQTSQTENICSNQEFNQQDGGGISSSDYIKLQINQNSLYGRFVKRAVIDNRIQQVRNILVQMNQSTSSLSKEYIGILIPHFMANAIIDPDFSLLVDSNTAEDKDDSICSNANNTEGLTRIQKIGIIIGSVIFGTILILALGFFLYKYNINFKVKIQKVIKLNPNF